MIDLTHMFRLVVIFGVILLGCLLLYDSYLEEKRH